MVKTPSSDILMQIISCNYLDIIIVYPQEKDVMLIRKSFKFKLKTNNKINQVLANFAGCVRFVWNKTLSLNLDRLNNKQKLLWFYELSFWTTIWKSSEEYRFLKDCPSQALQQKLNDLDRAFRDAFDKNQPNKKLPKLKKKSKDNSFRYAKDFKIEGNKIYLPKIGWVKFHKSREITGKPKNVTVSKHGDHWYVSIQTEQEVAETLHPSKKMVGIDLGIAKFATLSDGTFYKPKNSFKKLERKLRIANRSLSRKVKFSNNWKKQRIKVTKIHNTIANVRNDYLHWVSNKISKNHAIVVLEDLKIRNMSASAKGTVDDPGKNVKAKSGLNKSILDQGWYNFRTYLEYKQKWRGGRVLLVKPQYTSQTCSACNHVCSDNRTSQSEFKCVACGYQANADFNAALNVLMAGHNQLACCAPRTGHVQLACGDIEQVAA